MHLKLIDTGILSNGIVDDSGALLPPFYESNTLNETTLENSFSACLMVMDDNHRLVEWVAYHYHALPLRYLIVAVDPRSKTSPWDVLERWKKFIRIQVWRDEDYVPEHRRTLPLNATHNDRVDQYLARQSFFLQQCSLAMKKNNRTYVTLIDPDEYVVFNRPENVTLPQDKAPLDLRDVRPPSVAKSGCVLDLILAERAKNPDSSLAKPCLPIPRLFFNAKESGEEQRTQRVPAGFNATHFDTMRFRHHYFRRDDMKKHNMLGKNIIDVSRIDFDFLENRIRRNFGNPHAILPKYCWNIRYALDHVSVFRINHYLGSWESYSARDDIRNQKDWRSRTTWKKKTFEMRVEDDDTIRPWLEGFVEEQGVTKASHLLHGAGHVATHSSDL